MKGNLPTKKVLKNTKSTWRQCTPDNMKAVKGKNQILCLINNPETSFFNKCDLQKFIDVNTLNEREQYIANELYKRDVLKKVRKGDKVGYKTYTQKQKI